MDKLLPISVLGVDANSITLQEYSRKVDAYIEQFDYEVTLANKDRALSDKALLNKKLKEHETARKEYFKPYEQLKKELIKEEKKIKALSDRLRDDAKALENTIVDVDTGEIKAKEVETYTIIYEVTGTAKALEEIEKTANKYGATMELAKKKYQIKEKG